MLTQNLILYYRDESNVAYVQPVTVLRTGKRGRPRKVINSAFVMEAMSAKRRISVSKLAEIMGISRHTLTAHLKKHGVFYKFSALSDHDLDLLVKTFRQTKPDSGLRYLIGFLRTHGVRVQKRRVFASVARVDGLGRVLRKRAKIGRSDYKVARPNALWHIDGHHKLISWGIVIHGIVDGCSRTVSLGV